MPIIKSAMKRARQTIKRRSHNLQVKRAVHDDVRAVHSAIESGEAEAIVSAYKAAQSEIDRAVKKGTLHRNTAGRRKAQLSAQVAKATSSSTTTEAKTTKGATSAKKTTTKATAKAPAKKATAARKPATKSAAKKPTSK